MKYKYVYISFYNLVYIKEVLQIYSQKFVMNNISKTIHAYFPIPTRLEAYYFVHLDVSN